MEQVAQQEYYEKLTQLQKEEEDFAALKKRLEAAEATLEKATKMKGRLWQLGLLPGPMQCNIKTFAIPHDSVIVLLSALLAVAVF